MATPLADIVHYSDSFLRIHEVADDPRAVNGLQVENGGTVTRIVAAVDACQATILLAHAAKADLLLVHHGLFWSGLTPITGRHGRRIRALIQHGIALYSAHLPLDCHPVVGNNHVLAQRLGITNLEPFGMSNGIAIGVAGNAETDRKALVSALERQLAISARVVAAGPGMVKRAGIITGAGTFALGEAAERGLDTLITGEGPHHSFLEAEELGINLIYAGHYATETVGVQAFAAHLSERFGIPWEFVDHPTGM